MEKLNERLYSWASILDEKAKEQAARTARLPIVVDHVALMPDAHWGLGATVGSVIPTQNAVIPAAVGVDIGCGMIAVETDLTASDLPDDLKTYLAQAERDVPAGVGEGHAAVTEAAERWFRQNPPPRPDEWGKSLIEKARLQLGSLGSGNHFYEVCLDEADQVWLVLHSGSRGVGNIRATEHIQRARTLMQEAGAVLEDRDLAYLAQGTPEFEAYIDDMLWAQRYAKANRDAMMDAALRGFFRYVGHGREVQRINCHHNFTQQEEHEGRNLWITRKGAISAREGELGVIPGSMGAASYIVEGLGNEMAWQSCSHGAGRLLSRGEATRSVNLDDFKRAMAGKAWQESEAQYLVDESPMAYKPIDQIMEDQKDLVRPVHVLHQVFNYKGVEHTNRRRGKRR